MDTSNLHDDRTGSNNNPKERLFDFSRYRDCGGIHYSEFCDSDELQHIVPKLIEVASTIPVDDPRNKVLAAYLLTPSALTSMMSILFCYGELGTGKSSMGSIASGLYN